MLVIFIPPGPNAVEKEDIESFIEENNESVETYPALPKPVTVDKTVGVDKNPAVA